MAEWDKPSTSRTTLRDKERILTKDERLDRVRKYYSFLEKDNHFELADDSLESAPRRNTPKRSSSLYTFDESEDSDESDEDFVKKGRGSKNRGRGSKNRGRGRKGKTVDKDFTVKGKPRSQSAGVPRVVKGKTPIGGKASEDPFEDDQSGSKDEDAKGKKISSCKGKKPAYQKKYKSVMTFEECYRITTDDFDDRSKINYFTARVPPSKYPLPHYCNVCGFKAPYTCKVCGIRFCSVKCYKIHKDTRCLKYMM